MIRIFLISSLLLPLYFVASELNSVSQKSQISSNVLVSCDDKFSKDFIGDYICHVDKVYDKNKVPGKLPLTLNSRFEIFDVSEINEIDHSITIYFMIRIHWNDPGLSYKNISL